MVYFWEYSSFRHGKTYTFPAGTYYIGDICYSLGKTDFYNTTFKNYYYEEGIYTKNDDIVMVGRTANGDGSYRSTGSYPFEYLVDAGIIGIVSQSLFNDNNCKGGKIFNFKNGVKVKMNKGEFIFEGMDDDIYIGINTSG